MRTIWFFCSDITGGFCCDSCHGDEEYGYPMIERWPEANSRRHKSRVYANVCCGKNDFLPDTRGEWAALLLDKRRKELERGKE